MARTATPSLLQSSRRGRFRQASPLRRVAAAISPGAYRQDLPTVGRRRTSPVRLRIVFSRRLHAAPVWFSADNRIAGGGTSIRSSPVLHPRAVAGTPHRPQCRLPKCSRLAPSSPPLLRPSRRDDASCIPPAKVAGFEREFLYRCGPAQVGFGDTCFPPLFASPFVPKVD
jgi:hypothetical protein